MKKGISLVALAITMAIIIVLLSTVTIGGINTLNNSTKVNFATEINMIQTAVDTYRSENAGKYPVKASVELDLTLVTANAKTQFASETVTGNIVKLSKIDYDKLSLSSLKYGNEKNGTTDVYLVSEETGIVYYAKGVKIAQMTYYTLTDDLKAVIGVGATEADSLGSAVSFTVSETEWTKENVVTTVKVPSSYTSVAVSYLDTVTLEENVAISVADDGYNVYTIDDAQNNYVVTLRYNDGTNDKTSTFTVNNVDKEPPAITENSITENTVRNTDGTKVYLNIDITDGKSGIKDIKYSTTYVGTVEGTPASASEIASYFVNGGEKVRDNVIELDSAVKYVTIYAEDNVGNFSATIYNVSSGAYTKLLETEASGNITAVMVKADPQNYYGKTVTGYISEASDASTRWKIFYSDGAHIYLISEDYLNRNNSDSNVDILEIPNMPNGTLIGNSSSNETYTSALSTVNANSYYAGLSNISQSNPVYSILAYLRFDQSSTNSAMKTLAYMADQNVWGIYKGKNADYAIGGPTLEQYVKAYNSLTHAEGKETLYYKVEYNGYLLSLDNSSFSNHIDNIGVNEYSNIFTSPSNKAAAYRLLCPSSINESSIYAINATGINYIDTSVESAYTDAGFRPLVCLSSDTSLKKVGDSFVIK